MFLENFYEGMKISDVKRSAATIVENYGDEDYSDLLTEIAINNDLCIVITDKFNRTVYSKDVMGRNCLIHGPNNMSYDLFRSSGTVKKLDLLQGVQQYDKQRHAYYGFNHRRQGRS